MSKRVQAFLTVGMISGFFGLMLVLVLADLVGYFYVPMYLFVGFPLSFLFAFLCVVYLVRRSNVRRWIGRWNELFDGSAGIVNVKSEPKLFGMYGTPKLIGTYSGVPFEVENIFHGSSEYGGTCYYRLTMTPGRSGKAWKARYGSEGMLDLFGSKSWYIDTEDEALKQRLVDSGVIATLQNRTDHPTIVWDAKQGSLNYIIKVDDYWFVPSPEQFRAQLDLLIDLSETNERVNVG
jgi:hypothetical protein